jgi:uncharacterized protein with HEPN domain
MQHDLNTYLYDIVACCHNIKQFIKNKDYIDYTKEILIKSAVERQFEIIGEALKRISQEYPETFKKITDARRMVDFRNVISHGYDIISDQTVWNIIQDNLDKLLNECQELMRN